MALPWAKRVGWYPTKAFEVDMSVVELVRVLWGYLVQVRHELQVAGLLAEAQHRVVSSS